jgi:hypothetical protein
MTRALVWKEVREQWAVWLALMLAAVGGSAGLTYLLSPGPNRDEMLLGILWLVAWGYGLICGCLLLAGETEDGTQVFLDSLTAERGRLWFVKSATGLGLLAAQLLALALFGALCLRQGALTSRVAAAQIAGVLLAGGIGYAWGLFCGSFSGNVLSAVGWAVLLQVVAGLLLLPVVVLPIDAYVYGSASGPILGIWLTSAALASLGVGTRSRSFYCRPDLLREIAAAPPTGAHVQPGWGSLLWLAWQQMRGFSVGMVVFGVIGAVIVSLFGTITWPLVTVFAGILCGITTFADEQQTGAFRFPGDQRYPLGRVWIVKSSVRLFVGLATGVLMLLGVAASLGIRLATLSRQEAQRITVEQIPFFEGGSFIVQPVLTLSLWLVYGYAVGLLCGVLFRKPLVAGVVAVGVAYPLVSLWIPSVALCGWMSGWQVLGVPAILLVGTRLLMRPWASDRLLSRQAVGIAIGSVLVACLWLAAALGYRAIEIPAAPDAIDAEEIRAGFPKPEDNESGRTTLAALRQLADVERTVRENEVRERTVVVQQVPAPARPPALPPSFESLLGRAEKVASRGWGAGDARLGNWLDGMLAGKWANELARADDGHTGITIDARNVNDTIALPELATSRKAALLLVAAGLRRQADDQPEWFLDYLSHGLALSRNLRHRTLAVSVLAGARVEGTMLRGVELWLEELNGRPDLLRRALTILRDHEAAPQTDPELVRKSELLVNLNTFTDPKNLTFFGTNNLFPGQSAEADLIRFSMQVPWEKVRLRRILEGIASRDPNVSSVATKLSPPLVRISARRADQLGAEYPRPRQLCTARAAVLQVALRLYQEEKGRPAAKLDDLVPEYLPAVPEDPFDHQPFRYRLSQGESLDWPPADLGDPSADAGPVRPEGPSVRDVPAGQGILWCVGDDGKDDGGHTQESPHAPGAIQHEDVIFLVPLPPARR